jgi:hypothetical protein
VGARTPGTPLPSQAPSSPPGVPKNGRAVARYKSQVLLRCAYVTIIENKSQVLLLYTYVNII